MTEGVFIRPTEDASTLISNNEVIAKAIFRLRFAAPVSAIRTIWLRMIGVEIGTRTRLPQVRVTWPHQLSIGSDCIIEPDVIFKYDGPYRPGPSILIGNRVFIGAATEFNITLRLAIGDDSLIGAGTRFIDHDHGISDQLPIRLQPGATAPINVGSDCWIGANVVILKGVQIGDGAVIAAGAVVTKAVPAGEIWAGVPAKKIAMRERTSQA